MRIRLVSSQGSGLDLRHYLIRIFTLFISIPALVFLVGFFRYLTGDLNNFYYDYHLSIVLFLIFYGFGIVYTLGQQSFHDYISGSSVVRLGQRPTRTIKRKTLFWPAFSTVIVINLAIFFIPKIVNSDNVNYFRESTGIMDEASMIHMDDMNFSSSDIDAGNPDFFRYYDGYHGFNGYVSLVKADGRFDFSGIYDLGFLRDKNPHIPSYSVLVTSDGIANNKFMDEVSIRVFQYAYEKSKSPGVFVVFVNKESYFNLVYRYTTIPRLVFLIEAGDTNEFWPIVLPGNGGVSTLSFSSIPAPAVMSEAASSLR